MKRFIAIALAAPLLSGCALFGRHAASTDAAYAAPAPEKVARIVPPDPTPPLRRASMGPTGIIPCTDGDGMFTPCRRSADLHAEQQRTLMPTLAVHVTAPAGEE